MAALFGVGVFIPQPALGHNFGTPVGNVGDHRAGVPTCKAFYLPPRGSGTISSEVSDTYPGVFDDLGRAVIRPSSGLSSQWVQAYIWVQDLNAGNYPYGPRRISFIAGQDPDVVPYSFSLPAGDYRVLFLFQWWDANRGGWNSGYDWHFSPLYLQHQITFGFPDLIPWPFAKCVIR